MKLKVRRHGFRFVFYVPFWTLRLVKDDENKEFALALYGMRKELKKYKGLRVLEVQDKDGTKISLTL